MSSEHTQEQLQPTPRDYWRLARRSDELDAAPPPELIWPDCVAAQTKPPQVGDGVLLAAYDSQSQTGMIRQLGIVRRTDAKEATVHWVASELEIWVDTPSGRGFWRRQEGFRFARNKVAGYGLHEMFARHFEGLVPREELPFTAQPSKPAARRGRRGFNRERFEPAERIGEPNASPRGGYVYVLESAYGFKVGRTRNLPQRLHAFGVKLPFAYSVRLCAWFDDHYDAEARYHLIFGSRHINGEWFNLEAEDIELIRRRAFA